MSRFALAIAFALAASSCVSFSPQEHDTDKRKQLFDSVKALEGTWESPGPDGTTQVIEFKTSSAGSIVRETMFPGTPQEMTNIYRLVDDSLRVTHFCAMGNQPEMRATERKGNLMVFEFGWVNDLESQTEMYMGGLTLEFIDADHLTEHWTTFVEDKPQAGESVDIALTRRK
ncbi:MAG: hypothetical protein IPJ19_09635 [Planctomycetes bacterium]|nr:hypothetical protein [Planctomycetota bacterium]